MKDKNDKDFRLSYESDGKMGDKQGELEKRNDNPPKKNLNEDFFNIHQGSE